MVLFVVLRGLAHRISILTLSEKARLDVGIEVLFA
jgi:hypothetical protein